MINKETFQFPIRYTQPIGRIAIGWGVHQTVADECKAIGIKKALIVTTGLKGTGIVDEINQILTTNGVATEIYNKVTSNPKDYEVMEAYEVFKAAECNGVVSIGGGSSHDCGKGVRAVAANDGRYICDMAALIDPPWMEEIKKYRPATIPQVAVNTTAGTGAESTGAATITNTRVRAKQVVFVPELGPTAGLVDPLLIRLMPQNLTAWTGIDALCHAIDASIARGWNHYTISIALGVVRIIIENLREFTHNRMNHVACENMCWAENMAAVSLLFGGGGNIVHGFGHQISAVTGAHHGLANAALTIPGYRYNQAACPGKFAELVRAMGADTLGLTKMQAADKWFDEVERLLADLNIRTGHLNEQFGLQQKDVEHIVTVYSNDFASEGNPRDFNFDECIQLLESLL
ncbi:MAG TPA: iron-containing alcohol dehydrogenase [Dehalococcoidia bacterium]|nr:iron-containing alcohol dehydrogenase [Dehalococcoidia bacterium]